jgi:hypothetical protein
MTNETEETRNLKKEVRNIQTKASYDTEWEDLVIRIKNYMNTERRTWSSAIFKLLELGLEAHDKSLKGKK